MNSRSQNIIMNVLVLHFSKPDFKVLKKEWALLHREEEDRRAEEEELARVRALAPPTPPPPRMNQIMAAQIGVLAARLPCSRIAKYSQITGKIGSNTRRSSDDDNVRILYIRQEDTVLTCRCRTPPSQTRWSTLSWARCSTCKSTLAGSGKDDISGEY